MSTNNNKPQPKTVAAALSTLFAAFLAVPVIAQSVSNDFGLNDVPKTVRASSEPQQLIYNGAPISINLAVGKERRIVFDSGFEIGLSSNIPSQHIKAFLPQIYGNNLLLTINQPISVRVIAKLLDGESIPIDINAVTGEIDNRPIAVVRQSTLDAQKQQVGIERPKVPARALHHKINPNKAPGYVDLIRFAAQKMYAPSRYTNALHGAQNVKITQSPVRLMRYGTVTTKPIASWSAGGFYITAVEVSNQKTQAIDLDPRLILGSWRAASFHHNHIGPKGSDYDTTMLYLISDKAFKEAFGVYGRLSANQQ